MQLAKNLKGEKIHISEANRETNYFCLICDSPVVVKKGEKKEHHYAHLQSTGEDCELKFKGLYENQISLDLDAEIIENDVDYTLEYPSEVENIHNFNEQQLEAWNLILEWIDDKDNLEFVLSGYSGTGKSYLASKLIEKLRKDKITFNVMGYTGKSCEVLRKKGIIEAETIHSTIYQPILNDKGEIVKWVLSEDKLNKIVIIDEYSFLNNDILKDLRSFNRKILFLGDSFQLPNIQKEETGLREKTNYTLTEVVRQALLNPIVKYATMLRNGETLDYVHEENEYGSFLVIDKSELNKKYDIKTLIKEHEQIICGTNKVRRQINNFVRKEKGYEGLLPYKGERVMCLKNNRNKNVFNGQILEVEYGDWNSIKEVEKHRYFELAVKDEDTFKLKCSGELFLDEEYVMKSIYSKNPNKWGLISEITFFDYAYAISTHKCLTDDTFIYTDNGIKQLKDLNNGAKIGEFKTLEDVKVFDGFEFKDNIKFYNNGFSDIKKIKTERNFEIKTTDKHTMFILDEGFEVKKVLTKDLKKDDILLQRVNQNEFNNKIDLKNVIVVPKLDVRGEKYNLPTILTEEFSELLGMMVADGTLAKKGVNLGKRNKEVVDRFSFLIEKVFGYKLKNISYNEKYNVYMAYITSVFIRDIFSQIEGLKPRNKFVPEIILKSTKNNQIAFMRGLFEDGNVNMKNNKFDHIEFTAKEELLVKQVSMMLLNMGIKNSLYEGRNSWRLFIYSSDAEKFLNMGFNFISYYKCENLIKCKDSKNLDSTKTVKYSGNLIRDFINKHDIKDKIFLNIKNSKRDLTFSLIKYFIENYKDYNNDDIYIKVKYIYENFNPLKIISIEESKDYTYCLEIPESHTFIQNGFYAGNSQGSEYDSVLGFAYDGYWMKEDFNRWLYTLITRAKTKCTIIL